jgi:hypothetical protein
MPENTGKDDAVPDDGPGESTQELSEARRVGKSSAKVGDRDLRDAETFRALRELEKDA